MGINRRAAHANVTRQDMRSSRANNLRSLVLHSWCLCRCEIEYGPPLKMDPGQARIQDSEGGGGRTGISGADPNCCRALGKSTSKKNCRQP